MARTKKKVQEIENEKESIVNLDEIKEELTSYIDDKIKKEFTDEIEKANRKLIHEKNKRILVRDVVIIILVALVGYLVYLLYSVSFFDKYFNRGVIEKPISEVDKEKETDIPKKENEEKEVDTKPTLDELKKEYGMLLDKYVINEKSSYLKDYYNGKMTDELKRYLAFNQVDMNNLVKEDDYYILSSNDLSVSFNKLFTGNMENNSFDYDGNKVRFISSMNGYLIDSVIQNISGIVREITNIEVKDDIIIITTCEGLVKNDTVYEILTGEEIGRYITGKLQDYETSLPKMRYTFENNKLISLTRIV